MFSVDGVEQLNQTPRSVFLQPMAQTTCAGVGIVTGRGDSSTETVEVVHCHVLLDGECCCL